MMNEELAAIQQHLESHRNADTVASLATVVPTGQRVLGVRVPVLNELAKQHKAGGLELARKLWQSGAFEERLLAAKIIGKCAAKNPDEALQLIKTLARQLGDWAVCDTLGMEGTRPLLKKLSSEIWELAKTKLAEPGEWQRRFGLVLLTHFVDSPSHRPEIERLLASVADDKRHYVKKAVAWVRRDLAKL